MLIHLTPTFINPYQNIQVTLKNLIIIAGEDNFEYKIPVKDLALKKPYPNKSYYVACKRKGNKSFVGLLAHIEEERPNTFTVYEEWETITDNDLKHQHFHYITFNLIDNEHTIVSQHFPLWRQYSTDIHKDWIPVSCTPKMEFDTDILKNGARSNEIEDGYYFNGILKQRTEQYSVPTMPHTELLELGNRLFPSRMPDLIDGFNLTRDIMSAEEVKKMNNQINKEKDFLKHALKLDLPFDFCQTVYSFLLSSFITPEGFYQVFSNTYSNNTVFEYLEKMVKNDLLIIDKQDLELGFDDTSFLALTSKYDPSILVDDNESDEQETIQFALKALKQML